MKNTATILNLFPTPVLASTFPRPFSEKEKKFFENIEVRENIGNLTSLHRNVLGEPELHEIFTHLNMLVQDYAEVIFDPANDIDVYITQSWINVTYPGKYHHRHNHPNSIISGVLYLNAVKHKDRIHFYKDDYSQISIKSKKHNDWNSSTWWADVGVGDILLFPSSLTHDVGMVESNTARESRISLSFNTFIKGSIGAAEEMTGLEL